MCDYEGNPTGLFKLIYEKATRPNMFLYLISDVTLWIETLNNVSQNVYPEYHTVIRMSYQHHMKRSCSKIVHKVNKDTSDPFY